jgi:hypothetical protein
MLLSLAAVVQHVTSASYDTTYPWTYHGFESFPAMFFGANDTGLANGTEVSDRVEHTI